MRVGATHAWKQSAWMFVFAACLSQCVQTASDFNHLSSSASPYLLEHADNPVHWYEWNNEALDKAARENKPLLISIGYASCHWCHVMENESFVDSAVADIMNRHFVNIKIDREERPDIDQLYINAASIAGGNTGWPLNVFALPGGQAFHTTTYVPKQEWITLLNKVADMYKDDRKAVEERASMITNEVAQSDALFQVATDIRPFTATSVAQQIELWLPELDEQYGGLKGAPKFPMPVVGEMLLQHAYLTGHDQSLALATRQLDAMAAGAIYDHLAGGFARYATDEHWREPHYEKMLYDNAQLVSLYAHAWQLTKRHDYLLVLRQTLEFIDREMMSVSGGMFSSLNADTDGEEGKFYKWTLGEVAALLSSADLEIARRYFVFSEQPSPLFLRQVVSRADSGRLTAIKKTLLQARMKRTKPESDAKDIASWSGMMIVALSDGFRATGDTLYLNRALRALRYHDRYMTNGDSVIRSRNHSRPGADGFLEDYAWTAKAYISIYQVTFDPQWLNRAVAVTEKALTIFENPSGEFLYYSGSGSSAMRTTEIYDNVIPSSNTTMAEVLYTLGTLYDRRPWVDRAVSMVTRALTADPGEGIHLAGWARLAQMIAHEPFEVAVTGPDAREEANKLQQQYLPDAIFLGGQEENLPLLENKLVAGKTIFYVCQNKVCKLPTENRQQALTQLKR